MHLTFWRRQLLDGPLGVLALDDLTEAERDKLGAMMVDVMLLALKPWFDGRARLKKR